MSAAQKQRGLTLIELLITIAIASGFFALAIPAYRTFQAGQELEQAAKTLAVNLRFAQNQSLSGVKPCGAAELTGWYITFQTASSPRSYTINARCDTSLAVVRKIVLPARLTLSVSPGSDILFQPLNRDVIFIVDAGTAARPFTSLAAEMIITLASGSRTATVRVRKTGDIL